MRTTPMMVLMVLQILSSLGKEETIKSFKLSNLERMRTFVDMVSLRLKEKERNSFSTKFQFKK